jgi:uncharacterized repeat protein (TIGR03803 family)
LVALDLNGSITKLYDFPPLVNSTNSTGADSQSGLTLGPDGNFYSATLNGGACGYGTIVRITTNGATTALASLSGNTGTEIHAGLTLGPDGSLYGAAQAGGVNGYGTLFKWSPGGVLSTSVNFDYWTEGANPYSSLTLGPDGNLYGTASGGGTNLLQVGPEDFNSISDGTLFRLTTNGVFTPLVYFNGTNGANPFGGVTLGGDGKIYGTTTYGGISNSGTVFRLTTNGALIVLTNFTGVNGANPYGGLNFGPNGNLYGMTSAGGVSNAGTVFEISTQGVLNTLVNFTGANGAAPQADLVWSADGCFYGTTFSGGSNDSGTVFKLTTGGSLTTLVNFAGTNGASPSGDLIKGPDGNIYGTTGGGGPGWNGTVFRLTTNGTLTTLVYFNSTDGYWPMSGLTLVTNGSFVHLYGATFGGGSGDGGTVFRVNLTTAYAVAENTTGTFYPLTNEVVWATGGTLSLVGTAATNGIAQITGSGIVFTPATNFTGTATISYTVTNNAGGTNTSLITVLVTKVPPVAGPSLAIAHVGSKAVVWWDTSITGWTLQTNVNLATPAWGNFLGPIVNNRATNAPLKGNLFFRLEQ